MILSVSFALILALTNAQPFLNKIGAHNVANGFIPMEEVDKQSIDVNNVITVPPNCPPGFEYINGQCREVWLRVTVPPNDWDKNMVTARPNCSPGKQWINGKCRDVWNRNIATVSTNCPPEQEWVNGGCRDVFNRNVVEGQQNWQPYNIVTVPPNCPPGQEWINGRCTDVWKRFDENEPTQCAFGKVIDGKCVNIKELLSNAITRSLSKREIPDDAVELLDSANKMDGKDPSRRVVNVPNQCPAGYKPDSNGICREMWF